LVLGYATPVDLRRPAKHHRVKSKKYQKGGWMLRALAVVSMMLAMALPLIAQVSPEVLKDLAPNGKLRAAINYGNQVLVQKGANGEPAGVSPDLARALAKKLNGPLEFVTYTSAGKTFAGAKQNEWDVAFFALDPVRGQEVEFTAPYVLIQGTYLVKKDSKLQTVADVDQPGMTIGVGLGSVYDLYLTRELKHANLIRNPRGGGGTEPFREQNLDAAAGVREALESYAKEHRARDDHELPGNPAGDGDAERPRCGGCVLPTHLCRGAEGERFRRRCAQALRAERAGGAAGEVKVAIRTPANAGSSGMKR
jgi:polar amino acid transport system substrate-binding protein